jgi:hypothetical protein
LQSALFAMLHQNYPELLGYWHSYAGMIKPMAYKLQI